jgi:hypothetical protein
MRGRAAPAASAATLAALALAPVMLATAMLVAPITAARADQHAPAGPAEADRSDVAQAAEPAVSAAASQSQPPDGPPIRVGDHPGFGRIVFDLQRRGGYSLSRDGDRLVVRFADAPPFAAAPGTPRNVRAIRPQSGGAEIVLVPGATVRDAVMGSRVVIDVLDPAPMPSAQPAETADRRAPPGGPPGRPAKPPASARSSAPQPAVQPVAGSPGPPVMPAKGTPPPARTPPALEAPTPQAIPPATPPAAPQIQAAPVTPVLPAVTPASPAMPPVAPATSPSEAPPQAVTPAVAMPQPVGEPGPVALVVSRLNAEAGDPDGAAIAVPFGRDVGIAAFRRGSDALVVFDERRPLDLAALRGDRDFGSATVRLLAGGTLLRLGLPAEARLDVTRSDAGWTLAIVRGRRQNRISAVVPPARTDVVGSRVVLTLPAAGQAVTLADPQTGETLLVGTQRAQGKGAAPQGVPFSHHAPAFVLLPSWAGVAVEALADDLVLHPAEAGFALSGSPSVAGPGALGIPFGVPGGAEATAALVDAALLSRSYEFPLLPAATLLRRLNEQTTAAAAPALSRGSLRRDAAQTMIALGLGAEAQGVLAAAAADDPKLVADPAVAGLAAIAALVAGRPEDSAALLDPSLTGTDEIALWRAVRAAQLDEASPEAAASFAATLKLALAYPVPLAARILPLALETMAAGGEGATAAPILAARKDDPALALARALLAQVQGDVPAALAAYDALAAGSDRLLRARALRLAIDLRLATGRITPAEAAEQYDRILLAWRGDWRERALRDRLAAVQAQAGQWAAAFATRRETEALFPQDQPTIHAALVADFTDMLRGAADARLPPLDLVTLVDRNADLVPDGPAALGMAKLLADRLTALDLPSRADPLLDRLMRASHVPETRADLGATLAAMRLREGNAAGALSALSASASASADGPPASSGSPPDPASSPAEPINAASRPLLAQPSPSLPPALVERRALIAAQASARTGDLDAARAALSALATPSALLARAAIEEQAHDWAAAARALGTYVAQVVPADGPLDDAGRNTVLRWASAASQAGDTAALAELRQREAARMDATPLAGMFRLLTADPAHGTADLSRVAQETKLARALPDQLRLLQPFPQQTPLRSASPQR